MEYGGVFTTTSTTPIFDSIPSAEHIHTVEMMDHPQAGLDFMEELLSEGCWLEATGGMINSQNNNVHSLLSSDHYPNYTAHHLNYILNPHHQIYQEDHHHNQGLIFQEIQSSDQNFVVEQTGVCRRWWISPRAYPTPCSSVKERLILAIGCLKECTKDIHDDHVRDVHIQIWVPVKSKAGAGSGSGSRRAINSNSSNSSNSSGSDYQFGAQDWQDYFLGLHGRAGHVLTKLPDWTTAEVRFWRRDEYYNSSTRHHHVRGGNSCLAVPVFERGSGVCLGVVEIFVATITTTARTSNNYRPDLEYISEALESVDLRSFQNCSPPSVKPCTADELYQAALSEIIEVLTSVCKTHRLPLAITWAPCAQQGKAICRNSDDHQNYLCCISTIESAYYIADLEILSFLEACNEHHLLPGQGIVGTAFSTNKPCFAVDITAFSKNEYPLSHHARVFGLQTAVAIPLRSVYTGLADFMLEFFLPKDCVENEEQKRMLNSLSIAIQQSCRSLHFVLEKDQLEEEALMPPNGPPSKEETQKLSSSANPLDESGLKESSWIAHMMEAQQKGKGISVSLEYQTEPREEFKVTTHWDNIQGGSLLPPNGQVFSAFNGQLQQSSGPKVSVEGGGESDSFAGRRPSGGRKPGEKRRTKAEKTISLPVLRQYFAGSLKDAAKSIGVCPTTLKRICRQHGINRWPSRKIKKVGHSLRKLQLVIDSVHGTEGAIQIGSFYKSFPELSSPNFGGTEGFPSLTMHDHHQGQQLHHQAESGLFSHGAPSKSPTSSCSQTSGPAGVKQHTTTTTPITALGRGDVLIMAEDPVGVLHRVCSEAEFHALNQDDPNNLRSQSPPYGPGGGDALRVKATLGEEKIRFSLQPNWHFRDLQLEIARRFNVDDISRILVRYVDDDGELVLLTCDTDLEECKQIYLSSSQSHTIRLSLQWASHQNLGSSFRSSSPS